MKKDIYTLINEIDHYADSYEPIPIRESEINKWKQNLSKTIAARNKRHSWKRYAVAAAAFVLLFSATSAPVRQSVYAQSQNVFYSLAELLNIKKDISPYHSVIGSSFTKDGVTTTLNDVIWDDDVLLISYTMKIGKNSDFSIEKDNFVQLVDMYVNGKLLSDGSGGTSERIDDATILCTEEIYIPDAVSLSGTQKMELEFSLADTDGRIASRLGRLDFSVSGDELKAATSTVDLDETYTLPNGETVTFNRYTSNAINQKLYFSTTNDNCDYDIILKGKDNLGNPVEFYTSNLDAVAKVGKMVVDTSDLGYISDQASSLTLTPYVISATNTNGETSDHYKPMGKAFTISLH